MAKKVIEKKKKVTTPTPKTIAKKTVKPVEKKATAKNTAATKKDKVKTTIVEPKKSIKSTPAVKVAKQVVKVAKVEKIKAKIETVQKAIQEKVSAKPASKNLKKVVIEAKPLPVITNPAKLKPVKTILISQPKPELGKSPYIDLANEFKLKIDWRPFTHVQGVSAAEFRKQKIYIEQFRCIIFTSRIAIEQYFRICEEMRVKISEDNKYFCLSEAIALYLQKFIQYRKRKVFFGDGKLPKLTEVILKHKEDGKYLLPCSDLKDKALADAFSKHDIPYTEAIIYKTVASNLNDLSDVKYDMLVFFNSSAIDSLYTNFPKFTQDETRLAIFGNNTAETVIGHKLNVNIFAPTPENPSLVDAIKKYIKTANKR
ncbi:MAG: uroporphyrinogen-III synthase [Saprospirales bacterium]|nr:uroporphyrinogen-III synthase [Saprospirales bacterium]